jgi:hypothetical protein
MAGGTSADPDLFFLSLLFNGATRPLALGGRRGCGHDIKQGGELTVFGQRPATPAVYNFSYLVALFLPGIVVYLLP